MRLVRCRSVGGAGKTCDEGRVAWVVRDGVLAQLVQVERGARALLSYGALGAAPTEFHIRPPEPPLGRTIDLGHGRLWYASRDLGNVDLIAIPLAR